MARPEITGKKTGQAHSERPDELVPDPQVWAEFGISAMTGWRWTRDAQLDFPPVIKIRERNYRRRRAIEAFKMRRIRGAA
jgi:predicted DNA-binding transcriptional regulator AlpA